MLVSLRLRHVRPGCVRQCVVRSGSVKFVNVMSG
jgi:hypothetical protein